jgi:hypothetical protein
MCIYSSSNAFLLLFTWLLLPLHKFVCLPCCYKSQKIKKYAFGVASNDVTSTSNSIHPTQLEICEQIGMTIPTSIPFMYSMQTTQVTYNHYAMKACVGSGSKARHYIDDSGSFRTKPLLTPEKGPPVLTGWSQSWSEHHGKNYQ